MIEPPKPPKDELANDLLTIVKPLPLSEELRNQLLEQLTMLIVERDHKIHKHAYLLGRTTS